MLRPHRIAIGLYDRSEAGLARRHRVEIDIDGERTEVPELIGQQRPDLVLVNDDDLTYAKIRLDAHSLRTLVSGIGEFTESLPAALCWAAAWDMCRDAELPARDYVSLALSGVDAIEDITVLQTVLRQAASAVRRFADPAWRGTGLDQIAAAVRDLLERAEPGSDRQLAYAQAFAGVASSPDDLALLAGLRDGSAAVEGLAVDTELRWQLLYRLASRGAAGPGRSRRRAGQGRHGRGCPARRGLPRRVPRPRGQGGGLGPDHRRHAAERDVPCHPRRVRRPGRGGAPGAVREPLLRRRRRHLAGLGLGHGAALRRVRLPAWKVTPEAIAATDAYIEQMAAPPALHRLLIEGRDDVARALRCRERDAQAT